MNYILFEKNKEENGIMWTLSDVEEFCNSHELTPLKITEEPVFFVVELEKPQDDEKYRLVEITETISFIVKEEPEIAKLFDTVLPTIEELPNIEELQV